MCTTYICKWVQTKLSHSIYSKYTTMISPLTGVISLNWVILISKDLLYSSYNMVAHNTILIVSNLGIALKISLTQGLHQLLTDILNDHKISISIRDIMASYASHENTKRFEARYKSYNMIILKSIGKWERKNIILLRLLNNIRTETKA